MKIVHVQHPYTPGLGYQENHIPAEQHKLGHDVTIVTTDKSKKETSNTKSGLRTYSPGTYFYKGVETRRLRSWIHQDIGNGVIFGLYDELKTLNPDVIHLHDLLDYKTVQVLRYVRNHDVNLFVDVHIDNDNISLDKWYTRSGFKVFKQFVMPRVLSTAEKILPVNPLGEIFLRDKLNVPAEQIEFLPLGIESELGPSPDIRTEYRNRLNIDSKDIVFVDSGKFEEKKDTEILVEAVNRLQDTYKNIQVLLIGDGEDAYIDHLEQRAEQYGIKSRMHITGWVDYDEVPRYYNAGDIGIMPGKLSSGKDVLGVGLPLIVAESPATQYLIQNENGDSFERGNITDLVETVKPYIEDSEVRAAAGKRSLTLVESELSWNAVAKRAIEIYEQG